MKVPRVRVRRIAPDNYERRPGWWEWSWGQGRGLRRTVCVVCGSCGVTTAVDPTRIEADGYAGRVECPSPVCRWVAEVQLLGWRPEGPWANWK